MIYLSNFRTAGKDERAISIAAITPKWYKGAVRKDLAPKLSTLTSYKKGEITPLEYIFEYTDVIYKHDLEKLVKELDGHVLLCYCSKNEMCHRTLLGLCLHKELGVEIEEVGGYSDNIAEVYAEKGYAAELEADEKDLSDPKVAKILGDGKDLIGHWKELKAINRLDLFTIHT